MIKLLKQFNLLFVPKKLRGVIKIRCNDMHLVSFYNLENGEVFHCDSGQPWSWYKRIDRYFYYNDGHSLW